MAGTGKSTILRLISNLYNADDVGILSSNIEKKFGLSALYDKLIYICYEVKKNFGLEQSEFQSMISGEEVSIAIKHGKARAVRWQAPGIMAGNELGPWQNASGSMARRLAVCEFNKLVVDANPELENEILAEAACFLYKCCQAYLLTVAEHGRKSFWKWTDPYFKKTQEAFEEQTTPVISFLKHMRANDAYEFHCYATDNSFLMPFEEMVKDFNEFWKTKSTPKPDITDIDTYRQPFTSMSIWTDTDKRMYQGKCIKRKWVFGVRRKPQNDFNNQATVVQQQQQQQHDAYDDGY